MSKVLDKTGLDALMEHWVKIGQWRDALRKLGHWKCLKFAYTVVSEADIIAWSLYMLR